MRLFVSLDVPGDAAEALADATAPLRDRHPDANWTRPETWHLTLAFLGEVEDGRLGDVVTAVRDGVGRATATPRRLAFDRGGRFGRRVLWMGVEDEPGGAVSLLGMAIQDALRDRDVPVDGKPVVPHVTLARARGRKGQLPPDLADEVPRVEASWDVEAVRVVRSRLPGSGVDRLRYEVVEAVALA